MFVLCGVSPKDRSRETWFFGLGRWDMGSLQMRARWSSVGTSFYPWRIHRNLGANLCFAEASLNQIPRFHEGFREPFLRETICTNCCPKEVQTTWNPLNVSGLQAKYSPEGKQIWFFDLSTGCTGTVPVCGKNQGLPCGFDALTISVHQFIQVASFEFKCARAGIIVYCTKQTRSIYVFEVAKFDSYSKSARVADWGMRQTLFWPFSLRAMEAWRTT